MLYPDSNALPRPALHAIEVPQAPRWKVRGRSNWQPVPHGVLADAFVEAVESRGLEVRSESWTTNPSRTDLFGCIDVESTGLGLPPGLGFSIALRHSNVGRYAVRVAVGARVFVCANGMFTGEHQLVRRHVGGLDIAALADEGVELAVESRADVARLYERLCDRRLAPADADALLVEAARTGAVPWSMLGKVDRMWREPPHAEFEPRTAWSLYNAFTEVAKARSARGQYRTLAGLSAVFADA